MTTEEKNLMTEKLRMSMDNYDGIDRDSESEELKKAFAENGWATHEVSRFKKSMDNFDSGKRRTSPLYMRVLGQDNDRNLHKYHYNDLREHIIVTIVAFLILVSPILVPCLIGAVMDGPWWLNAFAIIGIVGIFLPKLFLVTTIIGFLLLPVISKVLDSMIADGDSNDIYTKAAENVAEISLKSEMPDYYK